MDNDTYFGGLYETMSDRDQRHMSDNFRTFFNAEADSEGFTRGQKSFFVLGETAMDDCHCAYACLVRGGYHAVLVEGRTILRRLDSKWIPRWGEDDDKLLERAEVMIIPDPFDPEFLQSITSENKGDLVWFIRDAIHNGVVIVIPTNNIDFDIDALGDAFGSFVETNFEVVQHGAASKNTRKSTSNKSEHSRDAATSGGSAKRKRKKPT